MQLVPWLILYLQSSQTNSVSAASHNTFMMSWTGSEYKTQTLWVILPCHTLLWETADVYCNSLAVWLAAEYSLLTLQIQKRTFLRSYHIWQLNNTPSSTMTHARNSSQPIRGRPCPCQTTQLRRGRAARAVARVCPWWLLHCQANQIAPHRSQPAHWLRHTRRARPQAFLIGQRCDQSPPLSFS